MTVGILSSLCNQEQKALHAPRQAPHSSAAEMDTCPLLGSGTQVGMEPTLASALGGLRDHLSVEKLWSTDRL